MLQSCQPIGCIKIWKHAWCSLLFTRLSCETLNIVCTARRRKWQTGPDGLRSQPRRRTHMTLSRTYLACDQILILALSDQFVFRSFMGSAWGIFYKVILVLWWSYKFFNIEWFLLGCSNLMISVMSLVS
jgi:hypothetical protein